VRANRRHRRTESRSRRGLSGGLGFGRRPRPCRPKLPQILPGKRGPTTTSLLSQQEWWQWQQYCCCFLGECQPGCCCGRCCLELWRAHAEGAAPIAGQRSRWCSARPEASQGKMNGGYSHHRNNLAFILGPLSALFHFLCFIFLYSTFSHVHIYPRPFAKRLYPSCQKQPKRQL